MKTVLISLFVLIFIVSCREESNNHNDTLHVSDEMEAFTDVLSDSTENLQDILEKFAEAEELKGHDILNHKLSDLKVVSREGDCYTVEANDAGLTRIYVICWSNEKITSITDKGIK